METIGYFLVGLLVSLAISAASLVVLCLSRAQRTKPSLLLIVVAAIGAFISLNLLCVVLAFFGTSALDPLVVVPVVLSWLLAAPALVRGFRSRQTGTA